MGERPRVSIVVPVHDDAAFLPECLDSLLGQSLGDIEIIVVDDASGDGSRDIAEAYASRDSRVRVLSNGERLATFESRNRGAGLARGDYLVFCDADDRMPPGAAGTLYETARSAGADMAHGRMRELLSSGPGKPLLVNDPFAVSTGMEYVRALLGTVRGWSLCAKAFRREAWERTSVRLPAGKRWLMAEDLFTVFIAGLCSGTYAGTMETVYWYRRPGANHFSDSPDAVRRASDQLEVLAHIREAARESEPSGELSRLADFFVGYMTTATFRNLSRDAEAVARVASAATATLGAGFPELDAARSRRCDCRLLGLPGKAFRFLRTYGLREFRIAVSRYAGAAGRKGWRRALAEIVRAF